MLQRQVRDDVPVALAIFELVGIGGPAIRREEDALATGGNAAGPLRYRKAGRGFDNPHFIAWGARAEISF